MRSVRLGSQSKMSMIFSAPSTGERMAFSEAAAGEDSGVNLTSSGAFAVIATPWMGMAEIGVTEMGAPIPGMMGSCSQKGHLLVSKSKVLKDFGNK